MSTIVAVFSHNAARFFSGAKDGRFTEMATLVSPESKVPEHELYSDAPSRTQDSFGTRHAYEPRTTIHEKLTREFAHEIGAWLDSARTQKKFTQLVLVAPPDMLGAVRKCLSDACSKAVVDEVSKNVVHLDLHKLMDALPQSVKDLAKK
jgi:protein required for attachment to host cells